MSRQRTGSRPTAEPRNFQRYVLSVRYNQVLFPFDAAELLILLPDAGYVLDEQLDRVAPRTRGRIEIDGFVGGKGQLDLTISTSKNLITLTGLDVQDVIRELNELEGLLDQRLGFDSAESAMHYEFIANVIVRTKYNPLQHFANQATEVPFVAQVSQLLQSPLAPFGYRIALSEQPPNQVNWSEVRIEPHTLHPGSRVGIEVIYRRNNRQDVLAFAHNIHTLVDQLIELVEGL